MAFGVGSSASLLLLWREFWWWLVSAADLCCDGGVWFWLGGLGVGYVGYVCFCRV